MTTLIFVGFFFTLGGVVGAIIGYNTGIKVRLKVQSQRRGIIKRRFSGSGFNNKDEVYDCTVLVREIEDLGNGYTRIEIEEVSGFSNDTLARQAVMMIGNIVPTNSVSWSDPLAPLELDK